MYYKFSFLAVLSLVSGCQTTQDQSIPLSKELTQKSEQFSVQRPTWRLSDAVFQQTLNSSLRSFEISGTETGWGSSEKSQLWFAESGGFVDGLQIQDPFLRLFFLDLLDMRKKHSQGYVLKGEKDFAFTVNAKKLDEVKVRCRFLIVSDHVETMYQMADNKTRGRESTTRLDSYLACDLKTGAKQWSLNMKTLPKSAPVITIIAQEKNLEEPLQFKIIHENSYLVNGEWRTIASNFQAFSGLHIMQGGQAVGALSFDGPSPKIWLGDHRPADEKTLMMAMNYSLLMYDWLDSGWRSRK